MIEVALSEVKIGQILAQPVSDQSGKRLVERGVEVTDTLLRVLQRRGIESVFLREGAGSTTNPEDDPLVINQLAEMKERLVMGFREHVDNPTMAVLYKTSHDFLRKKIIREASGN